MHKKSIFHEYINICTHTQWGSGFFYIVIIIISCVSRSREKNNFPWRRKNIKRAWEEEKHNWILHICGREREREHVKFNWIFFAASLSLSPPSAQNNFVVVYARERKNEEFFFCNWKIKSWQIIFNWKSFEWKRESWWSKAFFSLALKFHPINNFFR